MVEICAIQKRHRKAVRQLEREVYPEAFQLGASLFDDVSAEFSCVVANEQGNVVGYCLVEWDKEENSLYVADIVRLRGSAVRAIEMLQWIAERAIRRGIDTISAECRSTSVHLIEASGLEVLSKETSYCPWRGEDMTKVVVRIPRA